MVGINSEVEKCDSSVDLNHRSIGHKSVDILGILNRQYRKSFCVCQQGELPQVTVLPSVLFPEVRILKEFNYFANCHLE